MTIFKLVTLLELSEMTKQPYDAMKAAMNRGRLQFNVYTPTHIENPREPHHFLVNLEEVEKLGFRELNEPQQATVKHSNSVGEEVYTCACGEERIRHLGLIQWECGHLGVIHASKSVPK